MANDDPSYIQSEQKKITRLVTDRFKTFYLTGGTALSFHFRHRFSEDLDFFTQEYRREAPGKIMAAISQGTGFPLQLEAEQNKPGLVPMKIYTLRLKNKGALKIDFVQDFSKNIGKIKTGLHSVEDIYLRKIVAATGQASKESETGRPLPSGRQNAKDLFDLYYLSTHHKPLVDFFPEHFSISHAERLVVWYRRFDRLDLKSDLLDVVPGVDTAAVLQKLDKDILEDLQDAMIDRGI